MAEYRNFPIDGRASWVEKQHRGPDNMCVPLENYQCGPGTYSPDLAGHLKRHISTPSLGKSGTVALEILNTTTPVAQRRNTNLQQAAPDERTEFTTIFHDHHKRMGLDPTLRFCKTPSSNVTYENPLEYISTDGLRKVHKVNFGGPPDIPFGERLETKVAMPDYDVKINSIVVKPRVVGGIINRPSNDFEKSPKTPKTPGC